MAETRHWLVKQEPDAYPFSQLLKDRRTSWDGVRNYQARNNLRAMQKHDLVLYYHSVKQPAVVGVCTVSKTAYPDPTATEGDWSAVELKALRALQRPVTLAEIRGTRNLAQIALLRQTRLSVVPLTAAEFNCILSLGQTTL